MAPCLSNGAWLSSCLTPPVFRNGFENVDNDKKCQVIELLSRIPCASDGTLVISPTEPHEHPKMTCSFCSGPKRHRGLPPGGVNGQTKKEAYGAFAKLVELPTFQQSRRPRVVGMMALRRFALHSIEPDFLNIQSSPLASWCVKALKSSVRELRIAAGYVEPQPLSVPNLELPPNLIIDGRCRCLSGTLSWPSSQVTPLENE